jgi:aspartate aminotransferase
MIQLSKKLDLIKPSITLTVAARAIELKAQGEDIIDLGVGEPDFDTPDFIKEAAIKAIHDGLTKYTAVDGTAGLKKAIVQKFARENQLNYQSNQILVSCGAKHSLFNLFMAALNPGDEAIIPAPYWVSYPDMVMLADGVPVIVPTTAAQRFKMSAEQLEAAITPKTRLLILNSPSNPSGMAYTQAELTALAEVLLRHPNIVIATDDIYEHILWTEEPFVNIVNVCPELLDRTVVINGVSKAYAMTGWRIGYAAGPVAIITAMRKVQSQSTSNPNSIAQAAAETALNGDQGFIQTMKAEFKRRHDFMVQEINKIRGLSLMPCDGTFYAFISVEKLLQASAIENDVAFSEFLLKEAKISAVPGSGFGISGYIRTSFATSMSQLEKAIARIKTAVDKLQLVESILK